MDEDRVTIDSVGDEDWTEDELASIHGHEGTTCDAAHGEEYDDDET